VVCLEYANKAASNKKFKQNGLKSHPAWMDLEKKTV